MSEKTSYDIGQKFGKLTIIGYVEVVKTSNKIRHFLNCKCDCGKTIRVRKDSLRNNPIRSCGCGRWASLIEDLTNQVFGDLIVLNMASCGSGTIWKCKCLCGSIKNIRSSTLKKATSCGCKSDLSTRFSKTNEVGWIKSARNIYRGYSDGDLSFDKFLELSKNNCYYCGIESSNINNITDQRSRYSKIDPSYSFIYSGLDRVDNSRGHDLDNCVPCCIICNRAKNNFNYNLFIGKIKSIYVNFVLTDKFIITNDKESLICYITKCISSGMVFSKKELSPMNVNYYKYKYDGGISKQHFASLAVLPCFYCNGYSEGKLFNGLDRVNNNENHNIDNVVPCCKICNFIKGNKTINEFVSLVSRINKHLAL